MLGPSSRPPDIVDQIVPAQVHDLHEVAAILRSPDPDVQLEIGPGLDVRRNGLRAAALWDIRAAREDLRYQPAYGLHKGIADEIRTTRALGPQPGARTPAILV